ncbi:MAG: site-specific tyrosine recombinase XerD [Planctomycetia bacterium]|nr:site-specific tyrosine recombinase XerD [Planctomycetia bacterium]
MGERRRPVSVGATAAHSAQPVELAGYVVAFLNYLQAECGMSRNTLAAYATDLKQFVEWFREHGPLTLNDVSLATLTGHLQWLHERQLQASTIARHLVSIKMLFRFLVLEGVLLESVADLMSSPKLWQHLPKVLSPEKVNLLIAAPSSEDRCPLRDRALLCLLYATGCRASEVSNLKLNDVHLDENYCRCLGKGNKERIVGLNPVARLAIEAYVAHERSQIVSKRAAEWLFVTRRGTGLTRIMIWQLVKKYAARAGCSDQVSPHTLRHSFATHMLAGGAEIRALQELLGHANIATTQIYTHVEHSRLKAVHAKCHPRG